MGRPHLAVLRDWQDCDRCPRAEHRLGVHAPKWKTQPAILILALRADRATQVVGSPSPRLETFANGLAERLGLASTDVQVDFLLACGLGSETALDHVAACSHRLLENESSVGAPVVVVLVGRHASAAAEGAGLLVGGRWAPTGGSSTAPVVSTEWPLLDEDVVAAVAKELNTTAAQPASTASPIPESNAISLLRVVGVHGGSRRLAMGATAWRTLVGRPLSVRNVREHLAGRYFVAPFRPKGPSSYVVIDVDRHNPLQAEAFADTMSTLRRLFPNSLVLQSSSGGGRHIYVRLPPRTEYAHAALVLRAFFAARGLLFIDKTTRREERAATLRAARVEVPDQPVRLPFGVGSSIEASMKSRADQVSEFITFVTTADSDDYDRAHRDVLRDYNLKSVTSIGQRTRLLRSIEVRSLGGVGETVLSQDDPWTPVVPLLEKFDRLKSAALRVIATRGVSAIGTRTYWMKRLIEVAFDAVGPDTAALLMSHWLYNREHQSEDIEMHPLWVERSIGDALAKKKEKTGGVPAGTWAVVERQVSWVFRNGAGFSRHTRGGTPLTEGDVKLTAFFILRTFIERGITSMPIPSRTFHRFVPEEMGPHVQEILCRGTWLKRIAEPMWGLQAALFALEPAFTRRPHAGDVALFCLP